MTLLSNVPLPNWSPGIHWRLTLIALTESIPGDAYWIDNLRVTSASLLPSVPRAEFEVSLNGQQFSANALEHVYFTQPTRLTHVSPVTAGPTLGGSAVTIHGRGLSAFAQWGAGPAQARCRWGGAAGQQTLTVIARADGRDSILGHHAAGRVADSR